MNRRDAENAKMLLRKYTMQFLLQGIAFLLFLSLVQAQEIPTLRHRVTDQTGTLSESEVRELESQLQEFEQKTSNQVVVLMINSLDGENLEEYSLAVAEKNKLGKKGRDNGVFLFIAKSDRKLRIEVGYGLEGALTDAISDQINRNIIRPKFREGDYFGGIRDGITAIMQATQGEFKGDEKSSRKGKSIGFIVFAIVMAALFFGFFGNRRGGGGFTVGPRGFSRYPGLFLGGFGSGGGFSGSSFGGGGGGFSGGGGSFGGGGASGSW